VYSKKFIHLGEIYIGIKATEITTLLGSCTAVCLYDEINAIGGMNHYLLPLWNENGLQSPKFGNISIPRLIENMQNVGCEIKNIQAKIFGGANIVDTNSQNIMVGRKNILIAKEILREYGIPVTANDVGGERGRHIMMHSDTGKIFLKYMQKENG